MKFEKHLGSSPAAMPGKFQSDMIIATSNLVASRLHGILRQDVLPGGPAYIISMTVDILRNEMTWAGYRITKYIVFLHDIHILFRKTTFNLIFDLFWAYFTHVRLLIASHNWKLLV